MNTDVKRIHVIGAGVVGHATGLGYLNRGFEVTFIDTSQDIISKRKSEGLSALSPEEAAHEPLQADVSVLVVPTPTVAGSIDLTYMRQAATDLGKRMATSSEYHVVIVRSTVLPGTTEKVVLPLLEEHSGKRVGDDFGLIMNPEYLREAAADTDFDNSWLTVLGAWDDRSFETAVQIYKDFNCPIERLTIVEAETQKYVHNIFNAVKIAYFNEFRQICDQLGADADRVFALTAKSAEGMWNPKYGTKDFGPFDGMCLPKDTQAFLTFAHGQGWPMPILANTISSNHQLALQRESIPAPATARPNEQHEEASQTEPAVEPAPAPAVTPAHVVIN